MKEAKKGVSAAIFRLTLKVQSIDKSIITKEAYKMAKDVFLSHRGYDRAWIEQLAIILEEDGISCWYAPRDIKSVSRSGYQEAIADGIDEAKIVLVYITDRFEEQDEEGNDISSYVVREVVRANSKNKLIIPIFNNRSTFPKALDVEINERQVFSIHSHDDEEAAIDELKKDISQFLSSQKHILTEQSYINLVNLQKAKPLRDFIEISKKTQEKYEHVFIPSIDLDDLSTKGPLQVLVGAQTSGKSIHAINYLLKQQKVFLFEGMSIKSLYGLLNQTLQKKSGFIVKCNSEELEQALTSNFIEQMKHQLAEADSEMILCSNKAIRYLNNTEIKLPDNKKELLMNLVVSENGQEEAVDMIEEYINVLFEVIDVQSITKMEEVFELRQQILYAVNHSQSLEDWRNSLLYSQDHQLKNFINNEKYSHILIPLAIAFNHGRSYPEISKTLESLYAILYDHNSTVTTDYRLLSKSEIVESYDLLIKSEIDYNHLGAFEVNRYYFKTEIYSEAMWRVVWEEYYLLHEVLKEFLIHQLNQKSKFTTQRAKEIILSIIQFNFDENVGKWINPLAHSKKVSSNQILKDIIINLYNDVQLQDKIDKLLMGWLNNNNPQLEYTALTIYQSIIGVENYTTVTQSLLKNLEYKESKFRPTYLTFSYLNRFAYTSEETDQFMCAEIRKVLKNVYNKPNYSKVMNFFMDFFIEYPEAFLRRATEDKIKILTIISIHSIKTYTRTEDSSSQVRQLLLSFKSYCEKNPEAKESAKKFFLNLEKESHNHNIQNRFDLLAKQL